MRVRTAHDACTRVRALRLTALCAADAYLLGSAGSNACPTGSMRIDTAAACRSAAAALGRSWGSSGPWDTYPKGCFYQSEVYFNTHATGSSSAYTQPLCFAGAPLPPRPPGEPCPTPATECRWRSPASTHGPYASQGRPRRALLIGFLILLLIRILFLQLFVFLVYKVRPRCALGRMRFLVP